MGCEVLQALLGPTHLASLTRLESQWLVLLLLLLLLLLAGACAQTYGQPVAPGEEVSLEYKFLPDPRLEPRDFVVALTAFYVDSQGKWYSSTFFNQTVNIVEVKKLVDWELLFLIVLFAAGIAGIGEHDAKEAAGGLVTAASRGLRGSRSVQRAWGMGPVARAVAERAAPADVHAPSSVLAVTLPSLLLLLLLPGAQFTAFTRTW